MQTGAIEKARVSGLRKSGLLQRPCRATAESNSLTLEVLDTWSCLDLLPQLTSLENHVFGPDFTIPDKEMQAWANSGSWYCAAVTGQAVVGRHQIFSLLSVLIATGESRDRLLAGEINENELQPWTHQLFADRPAVYLASVVSAASDHLAMMYDSLACDLQQFKVTWETEFTSGFSIASGPAGLSHMARNGFLLSQSQSYRGQYPMMTIDRDSAATRFWQDLLSSDPVEASRAVSNAVVVGR